MLGLDEVVDLISNVLQLSPRVGGFERETALLGTIPEFDSMAVVSVLTAMEENFGITIDDDEISAEIFETIGSLYDFISMKLDS